MCVLGGKGVTSIGRGSKTKVLYVGGGGVWICFGNTHPNNGKISRRLHIFVLRGLAGMYYNVLLIYAENTSPSLY